MPAPVYFDGQRLPASYANFYIANGLVLVPTFNDPNDRIALNTLAKLFPSREVVGIYCGDLVLGLGTLHCMTMQQPLKKHRRLPPSSHACLRPGDDRGLPDRDHLVRSAFPQEPAQSEGLFPGRPQCALVGHRALHRLGRNQHAHRDRHARAFVLRATSSFCSSCSAICWRAS